MSDITLLEKVYEQQLRTGEQVAQLRGEVGILTARVEERLDHGQRRMEDHEARMRTIESLMPERLAERLTSLESDRDKSRGSSTAVSRIVTALIAIAGGGAGTALVAWLAGIHP